MEENKDHITEGPKIMTNLEEELQALKKSLLEMTNLVISQLEKCKQASIESDIDLAKEVTAHEKRVNGMEINIDRDCENILALFSPVATDLRFVLAGLKINHDLERVGDNAQGISKHLVGIVEKADDNLLQQFKIIESYDVALSMLDDVYEALENEDTKLVRKIFKKDDFLDENNKNAISTAIKLIKENPKKSKLILALFSIVRKLERIGDLNKNMGEEIIFHIEAKVLKHKKLKKKLKT